MRLHNSSLGSSIEICTEQFQFLCSFPLPLFLPGLFLFSLLPSVLSIHLRVRFPSFPPLLALSVFAANGARKVIISLHWLRVPERIVFKVAVQTYRALHGNAAPLSTRGSLHKSPSSCPDKDFCLPPRTICAFLPSDCLLLDVVLSLSLALVLGTLFLPTSLQHLLCSLSENV